MGLMNVKKKTVFFLMSLLGILAILAGSVSARDIILSEESNACLDCHAKRGIIKRFQNSESIEAYVDIDKFKSSAHNLLTCADCHNDFSEGKHPKTRFKSKEQYKIRSSLVCRKCHIDEQIKERSIHARLLTEEKEGKLHICTNCHGAHEIMPLTGEKNFTNEEHYCLKCHGNGLNMTLRNGEKLSLKIDASLLKHSVHKKLSCQDCHFGFSDAQHPKRNFSGIREFSIASADMCRRCHFDKYTKSMEGIHYAQLNQGNLKAPVCTDCHGSHSISHASKERIFTTKRCQRCHPQIYDVYAKSVHGNALLNEHNQDVPICVDCHTAHTIEEPHTLNYREKIPEMCSNCHANKAIVGKYGLSTSVVKTYLSDFHGITLGFYKQQKESLSKSTRPIAVCIDCHGIHNITKATGPDSAAVKANLAKRCQKCHKDATKNFPDAWVSHYESSYTKAPMVYIVNLMYNVFIPFLIAGLILQILLHIWRYAVNR